MIKTEMEEFVHNVLGTEYFVKIGTRKGVGLSEENMGECRIYAKEILMCTEDPECTKKELKVRTQEVVAHELLHAYFNEAGVTFEPEVEEKVCEFFMKNWRKLNNSIIEVLDKIGVLDK